MADHSNLAMSLSSHTSEDDSSDPSAHRRQPPPPANHQHHLAAVTPPPQKKPRGRPPGSKNKPKPPVVITQTSDLALKPVVIEMAAGADVVETVIQFARRHHMAITVLSGTGSISNVTLRHPSLTHTPSFTLHGPFSLMALTGTYVPPSCSPCSSSSTLSPLASNAFGISLAGPQGQIIGGIVGGKVMASTNVVIVASVCKNPEIYRVNDNGEEENDDDNNNNEDDGSDNINNMGGFDAANAAPLNCQVTGDVNVMQWGTRPSY